MGCPIASLVAVFAILQSLLHSALPVRELHEYELTVGFVLPALLNRSRMAGRRLTGQRLVEAGVIAHLEKLKATEFWELVLFEWVDDSTRHMLLKETLGCRQWQRRTGSSNRPSKDHVAPPSTNSRSRE
jgi:hypothetical protein